MRSLILFAITLAATSAQAQNYPTAGNLFGNSNQITQPPTNNQTLQPPTLLRTNPSTGMPYPAQQPSMYGRGAYDPYHRPDPRSIRPQIWLVRAG
jgi:hypothetical protein